MYPRIASSSESALIEGKVVSRIDAIVRLHILVVVVPSNHSIEPSEQ